MDADWQSPEQAVYREGFGEGQRQGVQIGWTEGLQEGARLGRRLGLTLGVMYRDLSTLTAGVEPKVAVGERFSTPRLVADIATYPLDNQEDPGKEARLQDLQRRYRTVMRLHGLCPSSTLDSFLEDPDVKGGVDALRKLNLDF
jgi:hypothetical protein